MPLTFASLDVPIGNGFGASLDVSSYGSQKCFVATLPNPNEVLIIQGSLDGVNFFGIARVDKRINKPIDYIGVLRFVRVERQQASAGVLPTVAIGAESVTGNSFGSLNVPASNGSGVILDSSTFGQVKTFSTGGQCQHGFLLIEASQDGINFESIGQFRAPWGPNRQQSFTIECEYSKLRVTRFGALPTDTPAVQFAEGKDSTGGGGSAPDDASYWTRVPEAGLTNESAMSLLATGIVFNTTGTGVPSIAVPGTDYVFPGGVAGGQDIAGGINPGDNLTLRSIAGGTTFIEISDGGVITLVGAGIQGLIVNPVTGLVEVQSTLVGISDDDTGFVWSGTNTIEIHLNNSHVADFALNGVDSTINAKYFADFANPTNTYIHFAAADTIDFFGATALGMTVDPQNGFIAVPAVVGLGDIDTGVSFPGGNLIEFSQAGSVIARFNVANFFEVNTITGFDFTNAQIAFVANDSIQVATNGVHMATFDTTFGFGVADIKVTSVYFGDEGGEGLNAAGLTFGSDTIEMRNVGNGVTFAIGISGGQRAIGVFGEPVTIKQAAIPDAAGGATIDAEARTAINAWLAAERTYGWLTP